MGLAWAVLLPDAGFAVAGGSWLGGGWPRGALAPAIWAGAMYLRKLALGRCGFFAGFPMRPAGAVLLSGASL
jgi:hypothetical protein